MQRILDLERKLETAEAENARLREELERQKVEHGKVVEEVHRSYRREIMPLPRGEVARKGY